MAATACSPTMPIRECVLVMLPDGLVGIYDKDKLRAQDVLADFPGHELKECALQGATPASRAGTGLHKISPVPPDSASGERTSSGEGGKCSPTGDATRSPSPSCGLHDTYFRAQLSPRPTTCQLSPLPSPSHGHPAAAAGSHNQCPDLVYPWRSPQATTCHVSQLSGPCAGRPHSATGSRLQVPGSPTNAGTGYTPGPLPQNFPSVPPMCSPQQQPDRPATAGIWYAPGSPPLRSPTGQPMGSSPQPPSVHLQQQQGLGVYQPEGSASRRGSMDLPSSARNSIPTGHIEGVGEYGGRRRSIDLGSPNRLWGSRNGPKDPGACHQERKNIGRGFSGSQSSRFHPKNVPHIPGSFREGGATGVATRAFLRTTTWASGDESYGVSERLTVGAGRLAKQGHAEYEPRGLRRRLGEPRQLTAEQASACEPLDCQGLAGKLLGDFVAGQDGWEEEEDENSPCSPFSAGALGSPGGGKQSQVLYSHGEAYRHAGSEPASSGPVTLSSEGYVVHNGEDQSSLEGGMGGAYGNARSEPASSGPVTLPMLHNGEDQSPLEGGVGGAFNESQYARVWMSPMLPSNAAPTPSHLSVGASGKAEKPEDQTATETGAAIPNRRLISILSERLSLDVPEGPAVPSSLGSPTLPHHPSRAPPTLSRFKPSAPQSSRWASPLSTPVQAPRSRFGLALFPTSHSSPGASSSPDYSSSAGLKAPRKSAGAIAARMFRKQASLPELERPHTPSYALPNSASDGSSTTEEFHFSPVSEDGKERDKDYMETSSPAKHL